MKTLFYPATELNCFNFIFFAIRLSERRTLHMGGKLYFISKPLLSSSSIEICSTMPSATCTPRSDPVLFRKEAHGVYFEVSYADIYNEKTDIIGNRSLPRKLFTDLSQVNPSNTQLMHNTGLSRTLVERAGR